MSPLPLDDRILFACSLGARSVTNLARKLKVAKPSIYPVANRLVELGLLEVDGSRRVDVYETATHVDVEYTNRGIHVDVDGEGDPRKDASDRCAATTTKGTRCQKTSRAGSEFCSIHAADKQHAEA